MTGRFHPLPVRETRDEIGGRARTVVFDVPVALANAYRWNAGQHVTVRFQLAGEAVRRSYSISSSPCSGDPLRITVKRVEGGLVSNHINDHVEPGDEIDVMPPTGGFFLHPGEKLRRSHDFFGAGSGITPLFSMIHTVLCAEPYSVARLVYGNRDADSIILREALAELSETYRDRLTVLHVLSKPSWSGVPRPWRNGRIDQAAVAAFIERHPPYAQDVQYYVCGPGGMNRSVERALRELDVPSTRIHQEHYSSDVEPDTTVRGMAATAEVSIDGRATTVAIGAGQTLLEAVRAAGLAPPFSCESGVCGTCRAHLAAGSVHMRRRMALEDDEVDRGAVLTCQAVPTSGELRVRFE